MLYKISQKELDKKIAAHELWIKSKSDITLKGEQLILPHTDFSNLNLSHRNLTCAMLKGSKFAETNLNYTIFKGACLEKITIEDINAFEVNFSHTSLRNAVLKKNLFFNSNFNRTLLKNVQIFDSEIENSYFYRTCFNKVNFSNVDFTGSIFCKTDFYKNNYKNIILKKTRVVDVTGINVPSVYFNIDNSPISIFYWKELNIWVLNEYYNSQCGTIKKIKKYIHSYQNRNKRKKILKAIDFILNEAGKDEKL